MPHHESKNLTHTISHLSMSTFSIVLAILLLQSYFFVLFKF